MNPDHFLYRNPQSTNRFFSGLYDLLGVRDFEEFRKRFALTDSLRCHASANRLPEKALAYCVKHLCEELNLFPNLETVVILGEDACLQFQQFVLERDITLRKPFSELLNAHGWAEESARIPSLGNRTLHILYCHHPTYGYKRSPSIARLVR